MKIRSLSLLTAALLSPAAFAQINPSLGTDLAAGDDTMSPVTLSFAFPFPGGTSSTDLLVDSNGLITSDLAQGSRFSESVSSLLANGTTIAVVWDDLSPNLVAGTGGVFFNDLGTSALITWSGVPTFGGGITGITAQLELFPSGRFEIRYDGGLPVANDFLVGCSVGGGAADPGASDLSAGVMTAGVPDVYEQFGASTTDLAGATVAFQPDGLGGYDVTTTFPVVGTVSFGLPGRVVTGPVFTYTPDGLGGYDVASGGSFDASFASGTALGLGDDAVSDQPLGFAFALPGGGMPTDIRIDSNGRISDAAAAEGSDFNPTVAEFLAESASIFAASDFSPNIAGEVWFTPTSYGCAVTWEAVPQFGQSNANTFQIQLRNDNSIVFAFENCSVNSDNWLVGTSAGGGAADPGEIDLTAGFMSAGVSEVYEFFDAGVPDVIDINLPTTPSLVALTGPVLGTNFDLQVQDAPGSIADYILLGAGVTLDVNAIFPGAGYEGCFTYVDLGTPIVLVVPGGTVASLPVPNNSSLLGAPLIGQGIVIDPVNRPQILNLDFTNSLDIVLGL